MADACLICRQIKQPHKDKHRKNTHNRVWNGIYQILWIFAEYATTSANIDQILPVAGAPASPLDPGRPCWPWAPGWPCWPCWPLTPGSPCWPLGPAGPTDPGSPGSPFIPGDPGAPGDPGDPACPVSPFGPGEPLLPLNRSASSKSIMYNDACFIIFSQKNTRDGLIITDKIQLFYQFKYTPCQEQSPFLRQVFESYQTIFWRGSPLFSIILAPKTFNITSLGILGWIILIHKTMSWLWSQF